MAKRPKTEAATSKAKDSNNLRRKIRYHHDKGMSQRKIAKKFGISRGSVSNHLTRAAQGQRAQSMIGNPSVGRVGKRLDQWKAHQKKVDNMNKNRKKGEKRKYYVSEKGGIDKDTGKHTYRHSEVIK